MTPHQGQLLEWTLGPIHWSRSLGYTDRFSTCGRFTLSAKIRHGDPFIRWELTVDKIHHSEHPTLRLAQEAALFVLAEEAAR